MSGRVDWLTSKRVVCSVEKWYYLLSLSIGRGDRVRLHSRDRRPRMGTPPSLPQGEECLTEANWNGSFYTKGYHKVGTDALVCPHKAGKLVADLADSGGQTRASVPTGWHYL
ncbi:hypothetical protein [Prevotella veroralis]|uniref:hypothetical protein n=1 Tax=Prevotella veroralis TaxID=28137 RepID=UPI0003692DEB|nr:hypothetical protein [Prevotella veroralis]